MYTLLSGYYSWLTQKEDFYVVIIGLDNAGKTTLLERIKSIYTGVPGLPPEKIGPTVGLNIGRITFGATRLNFWDLGGQKELQSLWKTYLTDAHAIVFVIDSTDTDRWDDVLRTFQTAIFGDNNKEGGNGSGDGEKLWSIPVLVLANKMDCGNAVPVHEIKEKLNPVAAKMSARESNVLGVSALKGDGVREAVEWLFSRITRNRESRPPTIRSN